MSRRRLAVKRPITRIDPIYKSFNLARFINLVMKDGKRSVSERIVYGALDIVGSKKQKRVKSKKEASDESKTDSSGETNLIKSAIECFDTALSNVQPAVEVKSRRVGGSTYQVPVEIRPTRSSALGMRWIVEAAKKRGEKTMAERLAAELLEASIEKGAAFKKKLDTHRMAKANQAYAHFRW